MYSIYFYFNKVESTFSLSLVQFPEAERSRSVIPGLNRIRDFYSAVNGCESGALSTGSGFPEVSFL